MEPEAHISDSDTKSTLTVIMAISARIFSSAACPAACGELCPPHSHLGISHGRTCGGTCTFLPMTNT